MCTCVAVAWTLFAGKDVPWDALHYHLYAGFSAFNDRLALDFFPAGPQTYLNPYAHTPLYLMVQAGWSSLAIGIVLACLHSVMLWMTWELARDVNRSDDDRSATLLAGAAVAIALFNPVLLQELGSSFTDITTGTLALAGYVALVKAFVRERLGLVVLSAVLLGASSALKMSNAFLALVPALPLVWGCMTTARARIVALVVFAVCAGVAAIAIGGPWAWRLEQAFGNPFFPMLNDAFHPPELTADSARAVHVAASSPLDAVGRLFNAMRDPRFLPSSLAEALARPFDMLQARRLIHTETVAADLRYVALLVMALLGLVNVAWRRQHRGAPLEATGDRAFAYLAAAFAIAWVIWLTISGNSRYFLPMACIAGVLLIAGLRRIFVAKPRAFAGSLAVLLVAQGLLLWDAAEFRWSPLPWTGPWVQLVVPARLKTEAQLYFPMDSQSQSFLLTDLAPGSAFVGKGGGFDSTPESYGGRQTRALIDANLSRLRMLKMVEAIESDGRPIAPSADTFDYPLRRLGLHIDTGDCDYIRYNGNPNLLERAGPRSGPRGVAYVYTCKVIPGPGLSETELERKRMADLVLDHVELACPELFPPRSRSSLRSGQIWRRNYGDVVVWLNDEGWVRFADLIRGGGDFVALGREEEWIKAPQKLSCGRAGGRVHVQPSKG